MAENISTVRPSPFIRVLPTAAESSVPGASFIMRWKGQEKFKSIMCFLTEEELIKLAPDAEMSAHLSTWKSTMKRINDRESVSQESLLWLSEQAKGLMRLIAAKLGYECLKTLSDKVFNYADDLLLDGWPVEIPGSCEHDIVRMEKPRTDENQPETNENKPETEDLYWVGPSLMYRPVRADGNNSDAQGRSPEKGDRGDGGDDSSDDDEGPGDDDQYSMAAQQGDSPEPLPSDLFEYETVYRYPNQMMLHFHQQTQSNIYGVAGVPEWPSEQPAAPGEYDDDEHGQPETDDHLAVSHVSQLVTRPPTGKTPDNTADNVTETALKSGLKRPAGSDNELDLSQRKKSRRTRRKKADIEEEKKAIEKPAEGQRTQIGRCLTCIRYKRKCPCADGIRGGKCWVCRGSQGGPKNGTQRRTCYWWEPDKGLNTYERAQKFYGGRKIPQNTREAIAVRQAADENEQQYEDEEQYEEAYEHGEGDGDEEGDEDGEGDESADPSSGLSSAPASNSDGAEAHLPSMAGHAQYQAQSNRAIDLVQLHGDMASRPELRRMLSLVITRTLRSGGFGHDQRANMEQLVRGLRSFYQNAVTVSGDDPRSPQDPRAVLFYMLLDYFTNAQMQGCQLDQMNIRRSAFFDAAMM